jgi:hypothetical protein
MKTVAVISRHALAPIQVADLQRRGFTRFVQVNPQGRCLAAVDAWAAMDIACGGRLPEVAVIVLPHSMRARFVYRAAAYKVTVLRSIFVQDKWIGRWVEMFPAKDDSGKVWCQVWGRA